MRLATWNVNRPKPSGWKIPPEQRALMAEVNADAWVLTETHLDHSPTDGHVHRVFSPEHPERRPAHERWAAIWSRWNLTPIDDPPAHRRGTVAAVVHAPAGDILVYGTVIAWANERHFDDGSPARMWEVHLAEIERQGDDWVRLRERFPDTPLVVAGDFNQSRDGSRWYGTAATRSALTAQLGRAGLRCLTEFDVSAAGKLPGRHLVDHICATPGLANEDSISCFPPVGQDGRAISDHPIVMVDLVA